MNKKLYKSKTDRVITGVCGGVAEYFSWDPSVVRVVWAAFCAFNGIGLIAYIVAAVVMPEQVTDPSKGSNDKVVDAEPGDYKDI